MNLYFDPNEPSPYYAATYTPTLRRVPGARGLPRGTQSHLELRVYPAFQRIVAVHALPDGTRQDHPVAQWQGQAPRQAGPLPPKAPQQAASAPRGAPPTWYAHRLFPLFDRQPQAFTLSFVDPQGRPLRLELGPDGDRLVQATDEAVLAQTTAGVSAPFVPFVGPHLATVVQWFDPIRRPSLQA